MWTKLVYRLHQAVKSFGIPTMVTATMGALGISGAFFRRVITKVYSYLWGEVEEELDAAATRVDKGKEFEEIHRHRDEIYEDALEEIKETGAISEKTRDDLIDADLDFLNGRVPRVRKKGD